MIEQAHRRIKRRVRSMLDFESEATVAIISVGIGQGGDPPCSMTEWDSADLDQQSSSISRDEIESDNAC